MTFLRYDLDLGLDNTAQILGLSLTGLTDHAIATLPRTSLRTVQRRIRHLMDTAEVRNRIQLGFHVARLGWLEAPSSSDQRTEAVRRACPDVT
ncbi:hypothetical protein EES39_34345 [Streptomyces sp. ADI92-24]|uniref:hypothetical protein n=1 Tax=Streptomyces sp. ADI92-24 TaxID=1522756 RepID=UPI000F551E1E|nr:hypothetical protein [Streptomyces sp. ADI92-24]RPK34736.1 hypothetical protein EES39_34345 [Streptomyces sp. ADI92-24]